MFQVLLKVFCYGKQLMKRKMEVGDNNPFWNHKHQRLFRQHSSVVERIYILFLTTFKSASTRNTEMQYH